MADVEREEEARLARKADRKAQHETQLPLPSTKISKTAANTSVKRTVSKKTNEREDILLNTKPDDHITSDPIAEPQSSTSLLTTGDTHPVSDSGAAADKPTDSKPHKQRKHNLLIYAEKLEKLDGSLKTMYISRCGHGQGPWPAALQGHDHFWAIHLQGSTGPYQREMK